MILQSHNSLTTRGIALPIVHHNIYDYFYGHLYVLGIDTSQRALAKALYLLYKWVLTQIPVFKSLSSWQHL